VRPAFERIKPGFCEAAPARTNQRREKKICTSLPWRNLGNHRRAKKQSRSDFGASSIQ
jgi:hypothetical protein